MHARCTRACARVFVAHDGHSRATGPVTWRVTTTRPLDRGEHRAATLSPACPGLAPFLKPRLQVSPGARIHAACHARTSARAERMDLGDGWEGDAHGPPPEIACAFVHGRSVLSPPRRRSRAFSTPGGGGGGGGRMTTHIVDEFRLGSRHDTGDSQAPAKWRGSSFLGPNRNRSRDR